MALSEFDGAIRMMNKMNAKIIFMVAIASEIGIKLEGGNLITNLVVMRREENGIMNINK